MVSQHGQRAERRGGGMLAEDRGRVWREPRRLADVIAAEEQEVGTGGMQERQGPVNVACADDRADMRVGHKPDAEPVPPRDLAKNWQVETLQARRIGGCVSGAMQ